jgi:hypothetical protein
VRFARRAIFDYRAFKPGRYLNQLIAAYSVQWFGSWNLPLYLMSALFLGGAFCWMLIDPRQPVFNELPLSSPDRGPVYRRRRDNVSGGSRCCLCVLRRASTFALEELRGNVWMLDPRSPR